MISYEFIREADPKNILVIDRNSLHAKPSQDLRKSMDNDLVKATTAYKNQKLRSWMLMLGTWLCQA